MHPATPGHTFFKKRNSWFFKGNPRKLLRWMVGARGFEPRTSCAQGLTARRINNLHGISLSDTNCYQVTGFLSLALTDRHSVAIGKVWWWAQNWAQSLA